MTRMIRPHCAVMCNLINTHTHTHTHTGVEVNEETQDGNGDGSGDANEISSGDENGDGDRNGEGNEDGIGEGGREAKKYKISHKSCRRDVGNRGDSGEKRKHIDKEGLVQ